MSTKVSSGRSQRRKKKKVNAAKIQTHHWRKASGTQRRGNDCYDENNSVIMQQIPPSSGLQNKMHKILKRKRKSKTKLPQLYCKGLLWAKFSQAHAHYLKQNHPQLASLLFLSKGCNGFSYLSNVCQKWHICFSVARFNEHFQLKRNTVIISELGSLLLIWKSERFTVVSILSSN